MTGLTDILAAVVRGERNAAPLLDTFNPADVLAAADEHGVLPIVANRLVAWNSSPDLLQSRFGQEYRRRAARDILRERELQDCLAELCRERIPVLLMKGAQLAYTHYARPDLRSRVDTDMLIRVEDRDPVRAVLERCGYESVTQFPGELVMYQTPLTKRLGSELVHVIDVHWRIANPQVFGALLGFQELYDEAIAVPNLAPAARGLSPTHALLLACIHRVAHHFDVDSLVWLYDIHLLASSLDDEGWALFVDRARKRGVAAVCLQGLQKSARYLHTAVPTTVGEQLSAAAASSDDEITAAYLGPGRRHVQNVIADLRALPEWRSRMRLALEHLLPPASYMRDVYAPSSSAPLPVLYMQRAMRGARKWLRRAP
jgi:hypothetical protein